MNLDVELWLPIKGYENKYEVSNLGRVKSLKRIAYNGFGNHILNERIIKVGNNGNGYITACLCKNGKPKTHHVHRLVATAFIYNTNNKPQVNHINGIVSDNKVNNLEWVTISENSRHSYDVLKRPGNNTGSFGSLNGKSKKVKMLDFNGNILKEFGSVLEAQRILGICESSIRNAIYKNKIFKNHRWEYCSK